MGTKFRSCQVIQISPYLERMEIICHCYGYTGVIFCIRKKMCVFFFGAYFLQLFHQLYSYTQVGFLGFGYIGMLAILRFGYSGMLAIGAGGLDVFPRHIDIGDNLVFGLITIKVCKLLFKTLQAICISRCVRIDYQSVGSDFTMFYELDIIIFNFNIFFLRKE